MAAATQKKRYDTATKEEVRRSQKREKKWYRDLRKAYGADYKYFDIFCQLWGWEKHRYNKNPEKAVSRLQKAMQRQQRKSVSKQRPFDADLQFEVGVAYLNGWLPAKNRERRAVAWFERSARQGSHRGVMALGYCYEKGLGGYSRDLQKMLDCYGWAAKQGNEPACYRIAKWMFEQENADDNLEQIKTMLSGTFDYDPADELWKQVVEREEKLREEARIDMVNRFKEELERDARGHSEAEDDWDEYEDEYEYEDEDDWDGYDDEDDWDESEDGTETQRDLESFEEELRNMDWGLECLIPGEAQIRHMAQLQYQMSRTADTGEWQKLSDAFDKYLQDWIDERLAEEDREKAAAAAEKAHTEAAVPEQPADTHRTATTQATSADIAWIVDNLQLLCAQVSKLEETARDTNATVKDTHATARDTNAAVHRTEEAVQEIGVMVRSIRDLQQTQNRMWQTVLETDARNRRDREHIRNLQNETETALSCVSENILAVEESYLKTIFGEDWRNASRLCDASCDALVTARVLMRCGSQAGIKNYAGIIITAISALEIETRRRFFDAYLSYLKALGRSEDTYPRNLTHNKKEDTGEYYYTLGSFKHIVRAEKLRTGEWDNTVNNFLRDCILSEHARQIMRRQTYVFTDRDGNRKVQNYRHANEIFRNYIAPGNSKPYADLVDDIVVKYRNKSAHGDELGMTKEDAQTCCSILGINISPEMYDRLEKQKNNENALKELLSIEGMLKELLRLTRPLA